MIRSEKIFKTFGSGTLALTVLKGIDVHIKEGEFVAIIGSSGAGKSTLLYQLSLLDEPTSGEVFIGDIQTSKLSEEEKAKLRLNRLGYVIQDYDLLPELTALENVILPILMQGVSQAEATPQGMKALERIGLGARMGNRPSQLSGGEQQRVSIARAIVHSPQVLFADEPTANLDSASGNLVMDAFADLHKKDGQTIIMITHEEEYAARAERIIFLKDGQIVSDEKSGVKKAHGLLRSS